MARDKGKNTLLIISVEDIKSIIYIHNYRKIIKINFAKMKPKKNPEHIARDYVFLKLNLQF
ncbi:hypothetical protein GCM10011416_09880 [Polaribacter pacificus]|uniref:Uncharacterized protein n=1 Tax=Polaribacter pacificus TaxID=1775173 RepID=A0A917HWS0_9FLAO|nr:hypothetical protein GCM10011416_09880 [Polaribacter pacificus]